MLQVCRVDEKRDRSPSNASRPRDFVQPEQWLLTFSTSASADTRAKASGPAITRWWQGPRKPSHRISLALQRGSERGAFIWGVLDALLADPRDEDEAFSGSGAGATNAVVMAGCWGVVRRGGASRLGPPLDGLGNLSAVSAIKSLVVNVDRLKPCLLNFLTSPNEQGKGVAQVGATVGGIDQTTQQSAALADRTSAAASALQDQAFGMAAEFASRKLPLTV